MMQQYEDAKAACPDALLFFRMGDFYELFHDDAKTCAKLLGLTLTSRDKGENPIPMAGFPHHQLENYIGKLIRAGHRVAVCDQVEDPRSAKGLVKREITHVVSPGTVTDQGLLDPRESNYLIAIAPPAKTSRGGNPDRVGMAWADLSTGRFFAATFHADDAVAQFERIGPPECLLSEDDPFGQSLCQQQGVLATKRPAWAFGRTEATKKLLSHFDVATLEGFGFGEEDGEAVRAAGAMLDYLLESQKNSLHHFERLIRYRPNAALEIDAATRRSLEITRTMRDGRRDGSLLAVLDKCETPMGSRMLGDWLGSPLTDVQAIGERLDAIESWTHRSMQRETMRRALGGIYDLQRLLSRVIAARATPRDLSFICRTLGQLPVIKQVLGEVDGALHERLNDQFDLCEDLEVALKAALVDDCPQNLSDGGIIRPGYNETLDHLRHLTVGGKEWISNYQGRIMEETGITSIKVGYNKVFGYYLEVTNTHKDKVPSTFIRKQTLKNAERYVTPELNEHEEKVMSAEQESNDLELEIFHTLRHQVEQAAHRLQRVAEVIATLDVLVNLAELAVTNRYCRPQVVEDPELSIIDGRHPVLDVTEPAGTFVPNDTINSADDGMMLLITGPNMAGKSTYIRQVALLTLMAQIGSFVPASKATIGIADRLFARVGASDELSRGQSTFMVEMTETARILNSATPRSLVILDEIGRGTSTYDGVSLAWAIVEHLHDQIGCRTLFATHYHELTDLEQSLGGVRNLNVQVKEWDDNVVFLHKIVPGSADKSYGIHVSRLAGVPRSVNERAKQILAQLESEHLGTDGRPKISTNLKARPRSDIQLTLFGAVEHPLLDEIRELVIDQLTPLEALQLLGKWKSDVDAGTGKKATS